MRSPGFLAVVLSLVAAGLLLMPAGKGAQTFSRSDKATAVFGVS